MRKLIMESSIKKVVLFSIFLVLAGFTAISELIPDAEKPKVNTENINTFPAGMNFQKMYNNLPEGKIENPEYLVENSRNENILVPNTLVVNYSLMGQMKTSWYGPRFNGRITANGETFDQQSLTAAHKSLPFGTLLKLTNPKNNKTVIVRINDRGPFIRGRQLDISKAAAESLDIIEPGVQKLIVEQVTLNGANFPVIPFN